MKKLHVYLKIFILIMLFTACSPLTKTESTLCDISKILCSTLTFICANSDSTKTNQVSEHKIRKYLEASTDSLKKWYKLK